MQCAKYHFINSNVVAKMATSSGSAPDCDIIQVKSYHLHYCTEDPSIAVYRCIFSLYDVTPQEFPLEPSEWKRLHPSSKNCRHLRCSLLLTIGNLEKHPQKIYIFSYMHFLVT